MKFILAASTGLLACCFSFSAEAAPASPGNPKLSCDSTSIEAPPDTTITSIKAIAEPVQRCRIEGNEGQHNAISAMSASSSSVSAITTPTATTFARISA